MNTQGQKTGGRQKGTPNKTTASTREFLQQILEGNRELINENFCKLEPYQMMTIIAKILPYITPKMAPKTEKDEQDIALQQMNSYLQLAKMVNKWEELEEEPEELQNERATPKPSLKTSTSNNNLPFSLEGGSGAAQSTGQELSLNPSTLDNNMHCEISEEEMGKKMRLQVYHKYAPLLNEKTQAELACYLMKEYGVSPKELLINGKFPLYSSTIDNTAQTSEAGEDSDTAQSASEKHILNSSTLDNTTQTSVVGEDSDTAQSEEQKNGSKKSHPRPYKQQQHRPFYTAITNKQRKR